MIKSIIFMILCIVGFILLFIFIKRLLNHWRYERSQTLRIITDLTIISLSILSILFFGFCLAKNMSTNSSNDINESKSTITSSTTTTTTATNTLSTTTPYTTSFTSSNTTIFSYKTRTIKTTVKTAPKTKKNAIIKHTNTISAYITSAHNTEAPVPIQSTKYITTVTKKITKRKTTTTAKPSKRITTTKVTTTAYMAENAYSSDMLSLVNKYRKANGKTKLKPMIDLDRVAYQRAKEIAENYSHTRPNGYSAQTLLKDYGLSYSRYGENLGAGSKTSEQIFKEWRYSPINNANILNINYKYVGSAYYYYPDDPSGRHFYWVQVFYTP